MRYPFLLALALTTGTLTAQPERQAENWHFGNGLALRFENDAPVLNPPSAMESFEGVVTMSDTNGVLLFYTNGGGRMDLPDLPPEQQQSNGIIWNRNHEVMYDMRGVEGGGFSARQSSIAMPDPGGEAGVYYLFTMEEAEFDIGGSVPGQPLGRGLSYFIIDMNLNGGLGGVRTADQRVYTPAYEALDATPMADGLGYWIICHNDSNDDPKFIITPLTASGVGMPVETPIDRVAGKIEFSPNGQHLLHNGRLYGFDNGTGTIASDPAALDDISSQAACFTPDSRFLYTLEERTALGEVIVRYPLNDLANPQAIERLQTSAGEVVLATAPFQIGPNGNIYFVEQTLVPGSEPRYGLSEITCVSSPEPRVNRYLIDLPVNSSDGFLPQTLPQYVDAIFATLPLPDTIRTLESLTTACAGDTVLLTARETGVAYAWSTGDTTASIRVSTPGEYRVTIAGVCSPIVDSQAVAFESDELTVTLLREEDRGCEGVFNIYNVSVEGDVFEVLYRVIDISPGGTPGLLFSGFSPSAGEIAVPRFPGVERASFTIFVSTSVCDDMLYQEVIERFEDERYQPVLVTTSESQLCDGAEFALLVDDDGSLITESTLWSGDGGTEPAATFTAEFGESYFVDALSECGDSVRLTLDVEIAEVCNCTKQTPDVITPNGDGTNDFFRLFTQVACTPTDYTLIIYNRWGQPIFKSTDPDEVWDGTKDGTPQNMDTYLFRMSFRFPNSETVEVEEGQFSLIR